MVPSHSGKKWVSSIHSIIPLWEWICCTFSFPQKQQLQPREPDELSEGRAFQRPFHYPFSLVSHSFGVFLMAINTNDSPSLLSSYSNNVQSKLNYNKFINPDKEQVTGTFHSKVAELQRCIVKKPNPNLILSLSNRKIHSPPLPPPNLRSKLSFQIIVASLKKSPSYDFITFVIYHPEFSYCTCFPTWKL